MDVKAFIPDFPFDPENPEKYSARCFQHTPPKQFLTIGAGFPGMVCAHEFMHVGLPPILLEAADRMGGRPYSKKGSSGKGAICEPGGMIFPFPPNHYSTILVDRSDLELGGRDTDFLNSILIWLRVIYGGLDADHKQENAKGGNGANGDMAVMRDETRPGQGKPLPVLHCGEVIDRPAVRAAIQKAIAALRPSYESR
ncbi:MULTISPECIES: FAD-dependent oxidoreductase [Delftia]|uniref:FAD-dependent oxidoreductase n=1 Tax=Delftia TaxID=80865 RepID=UPI0011136C01|nr:MULTISPECIES: FAD-dependent oxidoreductase [Delftia]MPT51721.1 hypothetical protein [Delftia sp.]